MRTRDGRIKVLDFGLARVEAGPGGIAATLTAPLPGGIAGTPAYMSPEQIEGRTAGPAADVFAFGVLMYEWISGRHPFQAGSPLATLARVLDSTPDPLSSHAQRAAVAVRRHRALPAEAGERAIQLGGRAAAGVRSSGDRRAAAAAQQHVVAHASSSSRSCSTRSPRRTHGRSRNGCASPISLWVFVVMGIAGSVGGIIRGHLVFTDVDEPPASDERARAHEAGEAVHRRADGAAADGRRAAAASHSSR